MLRGNIKRHEAIHSRQSNIKTVKFATKFDRTRDRHKRTESTKKIDTDKFRARAEKIDEI